MGVITNRNTNGGKRHALKPSNMLRAMRHVSTRPADADTEDLQKTMRKFKKDEPIKFLEMLAKAEFEQKRARAHAISAEFKAQGVAASKQPAAPEKIEEDVGEEVCLKLMGELVANRPWENP